MRIRCPECHFERPVRSDQIPPAATMANCPKCGKRFRFRDPETGLFLPEAVVDGSISVQPLSTHPAQDGDDPLPSGAVVPQLPKDKSLDESLNTGQLDNQPNKQVDASNSSENSSTDGAAGSTGVSSDKSVADGRSAEDASGKNPSAASENTAGQTAGQNSEQNAFPSQNTENSAQNSGTQNADSRKGSQAGRRASRLSFAHGAPIGEDDVPWEHPERYGFLGALWQTILRVMFRAPEFFANVHSSASPLRPAVFYALLGLLQTLATRMWSLNALRSLQEKAVDPQTQAVVQNLLDGFSTPMLVIMTPFLMVFQLMLFAAFFHLMIRLAQPEKADFSTTLRVIAYSSAPTILCLVPFLGNVVGTIWFLACIFIGMRYALRLTWARTALALAPIFIMWFALSLFQATSLLAPMV